MEDPICPACKAVNDEEAAYCDQCGQHLRAGAAPAEGDCPACGGIVETGGDGNGVCSGCGLALVATPDESCCSGAAAVEAGVPERLTAAILQRTRAGLEIEQAVAQACSEVLKTPAPALAEPEGAPRACPLCAAENPAAAAQCAGCGIWFEHLRQPQACPRCERSVTGGTCACGALLTLPALLRYIEPSVRCVCALCKQPYAVVQQKCPDCGGAMLGAEKLKDYAASLA